MTAETLAAFERTHRKDGTRGVSFSMGHEPRRKDAACGGLT